MFLFPHRLNPFTEFTISLGPGYVERLFDSLLVKGGLEPFEKRNPADRFKNYIELLRSKEQGRKRKEQVFSLFYTAHFYQQWAKHITDHHVLVQYYENALFYYHSYLELTRGTEESRYYAYWQMGLLQDTLHMPWSTVEAGLLMANSVDALRGEALTTIIQHYKTIRDWETAYLYSTLAKKCFFEKNPISVRRWFIHFDCYNWHVLYTHILICYKLGYFHEMEINYQQLLAYEIKYLSALNDMEIQSIHSLDLIFRQPKTQIATI